MLATFFVDPRFVASLSPPHNLLIYAETMASVLAAQSPHPSTHSKARRYDRWILDLIGLEAK